MDQQYKMDVKMITIRIPDLDWILTFDGVVLEIFYGDKNQRVHIYHIKNIQIVTDRKGKRSLRISAARLVIPDLSYDEQFDKQVNDFVVQVQQAISAFRFE